MDSINFTSTNKVALQPQYQTNYVATNPQTSVQPEQKKNGKKLLIAGATAAAAIAIAGIMIRNGNKNKAKEAADKGAKALEDAAKMAANNGAEAAQSVAEEASAKVAAQSAAPRVERALEEYAQGGNYGNIKKEASKNLDKNAKKIVKDSLSEAHSAHVAQETEQLHDLANATTQACDSLNVAKNARQGLKKANDLGVLQNAQNAALESAINADEAAIKAEKLADELGTKSAKKDALMARKAADKALEEGIKTENAVNQRFDELVQQEETKNAAIAAQKASPNYAIGQQKQAQHAVQTTASKAKRQSEKLKNKPQYQRTLQELQRKRYSGDKLLEIMDSAKSSEFERLAAEELLEGLTK